MTINNREGAMFCKKATLRRRLNPIDITDGFRFPVERALR